MIEFFLVTAMVAAACAGNVLLKLGADAARFETISSLLDWKLLLGAALFGCALMLYILLLKRMPLNVAQCFMSLQFVGVILAAYFVLHEPLPALRVAGVTLIALGVILVAVSNSGGA